MQEKQQKKYSKFLSLVLRHKPELIDLTLDKNGWANTKDLLDKIRNFGFTLSMEDLQKLVESNDKKRFSLSEDGKKIRANQGHSISVDLALVSKVPPKTLYHGTAEKNLTSIREKGLIRGQRHHVHLSSDRETARKVGMRYGKPVVLVINALEMYSEGKLFYRSQNGVWLTHSVPVEFIVFPESK